MSLRATSTNTTNPGGGISLVPSRTSTAEQGVAFLFGFCLQFNMLIGGGEGASATGGYGYRATDFICVAAILLLALRALEPRRLALVIIFAFCVAVLALIRVIEPRFGSDPRTVILALHYFAYSFAGLYVAMILGERAARDKACWGLILGLLATLPIFIMQANGYASVLVNIGVVPGYYKIFSLDVGDTLRYAGLWGHPNEASHVAALAAPAGAYFFLAYRRLLPSLMVVIALLVVFYYTQSRAGLLVGGCVLAIPFLFAKGRRFSVQRLLIGGAVVAISAFLISQIDFVSSRFEDPNTQGNLAERLNTTWVGFEIILTHPFGLPQADFDSTLAAGTGGVASPHNGFIFFAAIFGWLPLAVLLYALVSNLTFRSDADIYFALTSLGMTFSFMFEQLPNSYGFAFVACVIIGWAYAKRAGKAFRLGRAPLRHKSATQEDRRRASASLSSLGGIKRQQT